jgi:hypothetical protein
LIGLATFILTKPFNMKSTLLIIAISFSIVACRPDKSKEPVKSPLELSNYKKLTTNDEILNFLNEISKSSELIHLKILDSTKSGKKMPVFQ